ncbi:MAG: hypothetical protein GY906_09975 [bacterium]|nr:hypothetical protein [bacterium]
MEFKQEASKDVLVGLVVKDLLHGSSYDLRPPGREDVFAFDLVAADEFDNDVYRLSVDISIEGPDEAEVAQDMAMLLFDEAVIEAQELVSRGVELGERPTSEVDFVEVVEDVERWDLVVPDWLAPDGAVVPFGFRPRCRESGEFWPENHLLDAHGRVVLVPDNDQFLLFGIPAPSEHKTELPVS